MNLKKIWIMALLFGIVASSILYFSLMSSDSEGAGVKAETQSPEEGKVSSAIPNATQVEAVQAITLPISKGKRAVSVAVNEVQGVSGYVTAGAIVDIIVMVPPPEGENASSQILLQNVKVLAVGNPIANPEEAQEVIIYRTVTLEVLPAEGASLAFASNEGTVWLMLRSDEDSSKVSRSHVTLDQLNKGMIPQ